MEQYFQDATAIATFSLQARDWHFLANLMNSDLVYEDMLFTLKAAFRVGTPPTGQTLVAITDDKLGNLFRLFFSVDRRYGKEVGKHTRNRLRTALEAVAGTYPTITAFLAAYDQINTAEENALAETGRKLLRGKLG